MSDLFPNVPESSEAEVMVHLDANGLVDPLPKPSEEPEGLKFLCERVQALIDTYPQCELELWRTNYNGFSVPSNSIIDRSDVNVEVLREFINKVDASGLSQPLPSSVPAHIYHKLQIRVQALESAAKEPKPEPEPEDEAVLCFVAFDVQEPIQTIVKRLMNYKGRKLMNVSGDDAATWQDGVVALTFEKDEPNRPSLTTNREAAMDAIKAILNDNSQSKSNRYLDLETIRAAAWNSKVKVHAKLFNN